MYIKSFAACENVFMHGILRQIVVQVVLVLQLKHEYMCHALTERLPGPVLSHTHALHVWFSCGWVQVFRL